MRMQMPALLAVLLFAVGAMGQAAPPGAAATMSATSPAVAPHLQREIEALTSSDPLRQAYALYFIARMGRDAEAATPFILPLLKTPGPVVEMPFGKTADLGEVAADTVLAIGKGATKHLLAAIKDEDFVPRREAVTLMGRLKDPAAVDVLVAKVRNRVGSKRLFSHACSALVDMGEPAVPKVLTLLGHSDIIIRREAQAILGRIGKPAVAPLAALMNDADPLVRRSVAGALGRIDDDSATAPLVKMLRDGDAQVREKAASGLSYPKSEEALLALLETVRIEPEADVRIIAVQSLGDFDDPRAVAALTAIIADANRTTLGRCWAIDAVQEKKSSLAVEPLIKTLGDADDVVRAKAAEALGAFKSPQAVGPLTAKLGDKLQHVRAAAARALGGIGDPNAAAALMPLMADPDDNVREDVAAALGQLKCSQAVDLLIKALKDEDWEVRRSAAGALGAIGDPRAAGPLLAAMKAGVLQKSVVEAVGKLDKGALDELLAARHDKDVRQRAAVLGMLGRLSDPRATAALVAALNDPAVQVRIQAATALAGTRNPRAYEPLAALLRDTDTQAVAVAIEALGRMGDPKAVGPILAAAGDNHVDDPAVAAELRSLAASAMVGIGKQAIAPLAEAIKSSSPGVRLVAADTLVRMGDADTAPFFLAMLKNEDPRLRALAAKGLGNARLKQAPPELLAALDDASDAVRRKAARALGAIKDSKAIERLAGVLGKDDLIMQIRAAESLAAIGTPAIDNLIACMAGGDWFVKELCDEALRRITSQDFGHDAARWRQWLDEKK